MSLMSSLSSFNTYIVSLELTEDEIVLEVFEKDMVKTVLREHEMLQRESSDKVILDILSRCV